MATSINILLICTTEADSRRTRSALFYDLDDCQVSTASQPRLAYQLFCSYLNQGYPFDIVFLDYQLPGSNGISLANKLSALHPATYFALFDSLAFRQPSVRKAYHDLLGSYKKPIVSFDQVAELLNDIKAHKPAAQVV